MAARTHISALIGLALVVAASTASAMVGPDRVDVPADFDDLVQAERYPEPGPTTTGGAPTTTVGGPTTTAGGPTTTTTTTEDPRPSAIVALGDSFISGEAGRWAGNSDSAWRTRRGTDRAFRRSGWFGWRYDKEAVYPGTVRNECHRSDVAPILSNTINVQTKINLACSGAETADIIDRSRNGEAPQSQQLVPVAQANDVEMIVLSIGGNDLGFTDIIVSCTLQLSTSPSTDPNYCNDDQQAVVDQNMSTAMAGVDASIEHHRSGARGLGRPVGRRQRVIGLDHRGRGRCRQPPRDGLDRNIGNGHAVDAAVLGLKVGGHLFIGGRPRVALAHPDRDLVALPRVAGIDAVSEHDCISRHARREQDATPLVTQLVQQPVTFGWVYGIEHAGE